MIRESKKTKKKTVSIFGKKISENNLFAFILCVIIVLVMIYRTLYVSHKLSTNTEAFIAVVVDIYRANHGQRLWGYEMKYKYKYRGRDLYRSTALQKDELDNIHIGDCIEIIVSLEDAKVQKWNKSKGTFKCN
jgi:hypothetical protein